MFRSKTLTEATKGVILREATEFNRQEFYGIFMSHAN
jgi:hypothetical protein